MADKNEIEFFDQTEKVLQLFHARSSPGYLSPVSGFRFSLRTGRAFTESWTLHFGLSTRGPSGTVTGSSKP